jgi:hypothetical protein
MATSDWFDDTPVLGKLPATAAAARLRELGDEETAEELLDATHSAGTTMSLKGGLGLFKPRPYQHTAHAFGFLAPADPGSAMLPIRHAGNIPKDVSLRDEKVPLRVTLDRLRIAAYPGGGIHHVLFDFYAQHQAADQVEHLHFNTTFRAQEGESVAVIGYPLFVGLRAGADGLAFKCFTVNVKNDDDEAFLGFLESDVFKEGLKLASTAQPVIGLFSQTALSLTKAIAKRNRNVAVQDFYMGLDFSSIATGARLREGSYIAVQIPESSVVVWDWSQWVYNPNNGQIVNQADPMQLIPYNYVVLGVSRAN